MTAIAEFAGWDTSHRPADFAPMLKAARELFPAAGNYDQPEYWAGLRPMTPDNLPIFGRGRLANLWVNTGHGHMGWTWACGSARITADLIAGRDARARRRQHARPLRGDAMDQPHDRSHLPHDLDGGLGARARIGLIVLATDQTIEHEWRLIFHGPRRRRALPEPDLERPADHARDPAAHGGQARRERGRHHARPAAGLARLRLHLGHHGDRRGEACSPACARPGPRPGPPRPITAAFAAFRAFGARRLAVLTPYRADVNAAVRRYIEARGFEVPVFGSFNEEDDHRAARISVASIRDAAIDLGRDPRVDAVFVACTSLRVAEVAAEIEEAIGKPVTSSNHAMAWHALRLARIADPLPQWGKLFAAGLPED